MSVSSSLVSAATTALTKLGIKIPSGVSIPDDAVQSVTLASKYCPAGISLIQKNPAQLVSALQKISSAMATAGRTDPKSVQGAANVAGAKKAATQASSIQSSAKSSLQSAVMSQTQTKQTINTKLTALRQAMATASESQKPQLQKQFDSLKSTFDSYTKSSKVVNAATTTSFTSQQSLAVSTFKEVKASSTVAVPSTSATTTAGLAAVTSSISSSATTNAASIKAATDAATAATAASKSAQSAATAATSSLSSNLTSMLSSASSISTSASGVLQKATSTVTSLAK